MEKWESVHFTLVNKSSYSSVITLSETPFWLIIQIVII